MNSLLARSFTAALGVAGLLALASTASAVVLQGNPYTPTGKGFSIVGLQGIDDAHPLGQSGFQTQVNTDFEFTPSIGVSYDTGGGKLTDFGLGLYQNAAKQTFSTGLRVNYNAPISAYSAVVTVEDFDIKATDTSFNFAQKVAPTITLLGQNNSIFATFNVKDIFAGLHANTTITDSHGKVLDDVWNINFADILAKMGQSDGAITGFILAADMGNGEKSNSDPYLMLSAGSGILLPEPSNYAVGAAAILFAFLFHRRQTRLQRKARVTS